jgi:hypothetical protein
VVAPVALVRLDEVDGQDLADVEGDDRHIALLGGRQDAPAGVRGAIARQALTPTKRSSEHRRSWRVARTNLKAIA